MDVRYYMDVHIPLAISEQLRLRKIDILRAQDDGAVEESDEEILRRATELGRVVVTFDLGFKGLAERWQRDKRHFAGLLYGHQRYCSIGDCVRCLDLIATASEPKDWENVIQHIPW